MFKRELVFLQLMVTVGKHHGTGKTKDLTNGEGENSGRGLDRIPFWSQQEMRIRTK